MGVVLYQKSPDPIKDGVILYYSKTLNSAQRNYSATERELLAAFTGITELQHHLYGKPFTLVTDHTALSVLSSERDPHRRLSRWVAKLQCFDFKVVYKQGSRHLDADCLSRLIDSPAERVDVDRYAPSRIARMIRHIINEPQGENPDQPVEQDGQLDPANLVDQVDPIDPVDPIEQIDPVDPIIPDDTEDPDDYEDVLGEDSDSEDHPFDMAAEQRADEYCRKFIDILETANISERERARRAKNFTMQNNLLYRYRPGFPPALVIPASRANAVLLACHDSILGAHLGFARVYALAKSRFFWPKMRTTTCLGCQRRKTSNKRREGLIMPMPIAEDVFDTVGFDLVGPLPPNKEFFKHVLVCTDNLSKYVITVPIRHKDTATITSASFNHVIAKHGCPKIIISDNAREFVSTEATEFFRTFGIRSRTTSYAHPQTNGQTERFNRTLKEALTQYIEDSQQDWPDFLQAITFAYNISEHSVTKIPPFEMVFHRTLRIPIDNLLGRDEFVDPNRPAPGCFATDSVRRIKQLITANQQANKRRLDKRLSDCSFKVGDLVLVERPVRTLKDGKTPKLAFTYSGPYEILRKVHPYHMRHYVPRDNEVLDDLVDPTFIPRGRLPKNSSHRQTAQQVACERSQQQEPTQTNESSTPVESIDDPLDEFDDLIINDDEVPEVAHNLDV